MREKTLVQLSNLILIRCDAYLERIKPGIKQDTWLHLRNAPMFGYGLFPDTVIATAEQDIIKHEAAGTALKPGHSSPVGEQPTDIALMTGKTTGLLVRNRSNSPGVSLGGLEAEDVDGVEVSTLVSLVQRDTNLTNDNYCISPPISCQVLVERKLNQTVQHLVQDSLSCQNVVKLPVLNTVQKHSIQIVSCHVVGHVQSAILKGLPQKKGIRPVVTKTEIKHVKGVSFVNPCLSARSVPNVPNVVKELDVGGRLQKFWSKWETLGASTRVVSILREGYTLPFKMRPSRPDFLSSKVVMQIRPEVELFQKL